LNEISPGIQLPKLHAIMNIPENIKQKNLNGGSADDVLFMATKPIIASSKPTTRATIFIFSLGS